LKRKPRSNSARPANDLATAEPWHSLHLSIIVYGHGLMTASHWKRVHREGTELYCRLDKWAITRYARQNPCGNRVYERTVEKADQYRFRVSFVKSRSRSADSGRNLSCVTQPYLLQGRFGPRKADAGSMGARLR
jgi:hypothetical protein